MLAAIVVMLFMQCTFLEKITVNEWMLNADSVLPFSVADKAAEEGVTTITLFLYNGQRIYYFSKQDSLIDSQRQEMVIKEHYYDTAGIVFATFQKKGSPSFFRARPSIPESFEPLLLKKTRHRWIRQSEEYIYIDYAKKTAL